jgi:hypothetical protein
MTMSERDLPTSPQRLNAGLKLARSTFHGVNMSV